jgi:hypothetical protein
MRNREEKKKTERENEEKVKSERKERKHRILKPGRTDENRVNETAEK